MAGINANEATSTDLRVIEELTTRHGWKTGDTLLYQPQYSLSPEQQTEFPGHMAIRPDIVLQDLQGNPVAVFENKLDDPKKALPKLRLLYSRILKPRFLYACSAERNLFYDMAWSGLEGGEFRPVNSFLSMEEMKVKIVQEQKRRQAKELAIDTTIAGGYNPAAGKDRYYQLDCVRALLDGLREGRDKMLVHMATGLGKTRTTVALCKALLDGGLAGRILFVVDRRLLAEQARDDGFSLISPTYNSAWITTSNYRSHKVKDIHVVVIDTLKIIYSGIPSNFYDLLVVDECHRSINVNRKVIFEHFLCPRIGLTATPRIAIAKDPKKISDEDLAILDTYRLFGCDVGEPTYQFDMDRGIDEGFLAPYKVDEIKTHLTQIAVSVDIMSTGVDIPCARYISFAALTRSIGKYIQMLGWGARLDPKTGKFSFQVLDFVGLCRRMADNGKGTLKKNKQIVTVGAGTEPPGSGPKGAYFIVDNPDPEKLIQRVRVHEGAVEVVDNIPVEEAKKIFEEAVRNADEPAIKSLKQALEEKEAYEPTLDEVAAVEEWAARPKIWLDEGQLQRIYDYPAGSMWDFFLHVLGKRKIPTPRERIEAGYDQFINSADFSDDQVHALRKIRDTFIANLAGHGRVDARSIFANPIYSLIIGNYDEVNSKFEGRLDEVISTMQENFHMATTTKEVA